MLATIAGMQVLAGDVSAAADSFRAFFSVWERFGLLPERFLYGGGGALHPTEQYYPLRPELVESAFYLHQVHLLHLAWVLCDMTASYLKAWEMHALAADLP